MSGDLARRLAFCTDALVEARVENKRLLRREEKLREALRSFREEYVDNLAYGDAALSLEEAKKSLARFESDIGFDEPHGNFSDTQDTNPEGGC